ncbi:MAG: hypothetical protein WBA98_02295 [Gordonia sp. (in: high G+C Gram-positive bacteria)]|uniref:hypothetical protein n=1 Tax=Gordonia sp. (in: high G+C Gram-positive bacteria) TaxID=84139 RepID=UPI003C77049F
MAHIDSSEIKIDQSRMTVLVADGSILAVPLTARVDTDTGEVTFHTDPASLTSAARTGPNRREPSDPGTADDRSHGAVVAPSPTSLTHRDA